MLDKVAAVYNTSTEDVSFFHQTYGESALNIDCAPDTHNVLIGNQNEILLYDWSKYVKKKKIYTLPNEEEENRYMFLMMSDERIVVVDLNQIEVIDLRTTTCIAKLATIELGDDEQPEFYQI